ncbi:MerR family transcriptional regulator [Salinispora tropica]|uniref:Transcriptional regulator n=1 Tax=Salinispora tropica (strain ATCC BAA-916 / DSM 44818 / JCM 13857 / NBRC 105044 / CNB-440) TaxID=369723 RepID=A4X8D6_SALTO|nr:MerR family transcriptional regulator [Salinispora tropica]ABP55136.1 transcriptional regulator [Salinispora tropica CNB-440]
MRISELSKQSGLSVPTIKFYLREGLLQPGVRTGRNQAEYAEEHLARLWFVKVLTGPGRLGISDVREVLTAIDSRGRPLRGLCSVISPTVAAMPMVDGEDDVRLEVDRYVNRLGWQVDDDAAERRTLAQVLVMLRRLGWPDGAEVFDAYATAACELGASEAADLSADPSDAEVCMRLTARLVLLDVALTALRRMALTHHAGSGPQPNPQVP